MLVLCCRCCARRGRQLPTPSPPPVLRTAREEHSRTVGAYYALSIVVGAAWALWLLGLFVTLPIFNCLAAAATFVPGATAEQQEAELQVLMAWAASFASQLPEALGEAALAIAAGDEPVPLLGIHVMAAFWATKGQPVVIENDGICYLFKPIEVPFETSPLMTGAPIVLSLFGPSGGFAHIHRRSPRITFTAEWVRGLPLFEACPQHAKLLKLLTAGKRKQHDVAAGGAARRRRRVRRRRLRRIMLRWSSA